jgi:putative addiction module antidote
MHAVVKIRKVGNALGLTLPKSLVERLHLQEGDELQAIVTEEGVVLTPFDPNFEEAMKAFEKVRRSYRNTLRELAK